MVWIHHLGIGQEPKKILDTSDKINYLDRAIIVLYTLKIRHLSHCLHYMLCEMDNILSCPIYSN